MPTTNESLVENDDLILNPRLRIFSTLNNAITTSIEEYSVDQNSGVITQERIKLFNSGSIFFNKTIILIMIIS